MSDAQGFPPPPPPPPLPPGTPPPVTPYGRVPPPWEQTGPAVQRFIDTMKGVLMQPAAFFRSMRREGGVGPPLIYAVIGAVIGSVLSFLTQLMMPFGPLAMADGGGGFLFAVVMVPIVSVIAVLVFSGILQVLLTLIASTRQPFETSLRVVAYAMGSTWPLNVVPLVGGIVFAVWLLVVLILGTAEAHEVSQGHAAVAVLLPSVICCIIAALFAGTIMALIFGAAAAGMSG
jgi:hypothetical protein